MLIFSTRGWEVLILGRGDEVMSFVSPLSGVCLFFVWGEWFGFFGCRAQIFF